MQQAGDESYHALKNPLELPDSFRCTFRTFAEMSKVRDHFRQNKVMEFFFGYFRNISKFAQILRAINFANDLVVK